jgi:hypothetical protein
MTSSIWVHCLLHKTIRGPAWAQLPASRLAYLRQRPGPYGFVFSSTSAWAGFARTIETLVFEAMTGFIWVQSLQRKRKAAFSFSFAEEIRKYLRWLVYWACAHSIRPAVSVCLGNDREDSAQCIQKKSKRYKSSSLPETKLAARGRNIWRGLDPPQQQAPYSANPVETLGPGEKQQTGLRRFRNLRRVLTVKVHHRVACRANGARKILAQS